MQRQGSNLNIPSVAALRFWALLLLSAVHLFSSDFSEENVEVSLESKIGQLLMVGFRGLEVDDQHPIVQDMRELNLGGVILSNYDIASENHLRNIKSPSQLRQLTEQLQQASAVPLLIAVDHEGGVITRLKESYGFPPTVSHQQLGALDDLTITRSEAQKMAKTLAAIGFNLNLAPVVDLAVNPDNPIIARKERSFSADPDVVTRHAAEFIRAHRKQGVECALKHFPGHGSSKQDSHLGLVDVSDVWSRTELEPYKKLIQAEEIRVVMTAHVFNKNLDPEYPATLSKATIKGLLRDELNFEGVVISDDILMKAITENYGFETAIQKALEAGIDIILITNNADHYDEAIARRAFSVIQKLVEEGIISEARIDQSYQRIQKLKESL